MAKAAPAKAAREAPAAIGATLDLQHYAPALIAWLANKLARSASITYQREFGVNVTEWRILSQLAIEPGIPAARICQVIGFDKGPVSRTLAVLQTKGLVEIADDPQDARRRRIWLSASGAALHERILQVALERERRLLSCLSPDEQEVLIGLLNRLHENLPAVTRPIAVPPERPV